MNFVFTILDNKKKLPVKMDRLHRKHRVQANNPPKSNFLIYEQD